MDEVLSNDKLNLISELITRQMPDVIAKCRKCKTGEERFKLALKIVAANYVHLFDSECRQKDSQHSVKSRENGNKSFISGQYYEAVKEYTESIVYAVDSSEEQALAYANRSAALFELKKYADCIVDIDKALNPKYPDKLKMKVYKRKGLCLKTLGRLGAESSFKEALVWLDKTNMSKVDMNKTRSELNKLISDLSTLGKPPANVMQYRMPEIVKRNPEIPSASDAVTIKYSKKFGRHLVATRKIKPGEVLVLEKPYCLRLKFQSLYTHCSYCVKVSWNMIPCKCCIHVAYCSEACKDKAWDEYHEVECTVTPFLLPFKFNNIIWISIRMAIKATQKGVNLNTLKQELTNIDRNQDPRTKGYGDDGKFYSDQYRSVYSLSNNVDKYSTVDLFSEAVKVALAVYILARESLIFEKKLALDMLVKNPDVIFLGGLISKNIHNVSTNLESFGASRSVRTFEHGDALLAVCSFLNHSCDPNVTRQCYADCTALYACYPIEQGEQIFDCYGPRFTTMAKDERQRHLKRWHFECGCLPCKHNWPLLIDIPSYRRQLLSQQNKNQLDKVMQKLRVHNSAMQKGIIENSLNVLNELLEIIELLFQLAQRPCGELIVALTMLKDYYETADAMFDYVPANRSKIEKERIFYYSCFLLKYLE